MKKLIICSNHSYPHVGGVEKIVQMISESIVKDFDYKCNIISSNTKKTFKHNDVTYHKYPLNSNMFLDLINKIDADHLFVYSDVFKYWPCIVENANEIKAKKSIALVGMNYMRENVGLLKDFVDKKNQFKTIVHSENYIDYQLCNNIYHNLDYVIPNAIDFNEFKNNKIYFREKYNISYDKKIVLCVGNFFPKKGQDELGKILQILYSKYKNFVAIFICTTSMYQFCQIALSQHRQQLKKYNYESIVLQDIPREDVIGAFQSADVFVTASMKEVAPICILESMAAYTPWVSLPVGNVAELDGGIVVDCSKKDINDNFVIDSDVRAQFANTIKILLEDQNMNLRLGEKGFTMMYNKFNWDKIKRQYAEVFNG